MINILKTALFAAVFMAFFLVFVPLRWVLPPGTGVLMPLGLLGLVPLGIGFAIVLWCLWEFATRGQGTPAVFDPPKNLVVRGPYKYVRNPMYIGAGTALFGAALRSGSLALAGYAVVFLLITHLFVLLYEEPHLRGVFGESYADYRRTVHRWIPTWRS